MSLAKVKSIKTFTGSLGGSVAGGDAELVVGLDQGANDSFVMPMKQAVQVFEDPTLHRQQSRLLRIR